MSDKSTLLFKDGIASYPLCLFIHGLAMNMNLWVSPDEAKVFAGRASVDIMLSEDLREEIVKSAVMPEVKHISTGIKKKSFRTLFHDLTARGYPSLAWSQKRPAGFIEYAIDELKEILDAYKEKTKNGLIFICHSRGGLIARKFLEQERPDVRALITLSTPHRGSNIAKLGTTIAPYASVISSMFGDSEKGTVSNAIKRTLMFLQCDAIRELLPESDFIASLNENRPDKNIFKLSLGGTASTLFSLYKTKVSKMDGQESTYIVRYKKILSFPGIFESLISKRLIPPEIVEGLGDGLVSGESSIMPFADIHLKYELNHLKVVYNEEVRGDVLSYINNLT